MNEEVIKECIREIDTIKKRLTGLLNNKEIDIFEKPTLSEIKYYFSVQKLTGDGGEYLKFYNHYESNGWKVGKNKMKNWKAAAAQWIKRNEERKRDHQEGSRFDRAVSAATAGINDPNTL